MSDFGVTSAGFILKRLTDLLAAKRAKAVELFQDQVQPGDTVDTSDSSALGRLISLETPSEADLWELAQMVYAAFDPNSATGIPLDNLVSYTGISRQGASYDTTNGLFAGDNGTLINAGNTVAAPITGNRFTTSSSVSLSPSQAAGVTIEILTVANSTAYTITYSTSSSVSNTVTYTSDASATSVEILDGLLNVIDISHPLLAASISGTTLIVDKADIFQPSNFSVSSNLNIIKVKKTGGLQATIVGALNQEANTITQIITPVLGWDSVTNPSASIGGRLLETDEELRTRFRNTKLERASNILDSLYSALINVEGVEEVTIYENDTSVTDANGVPAHSFFPVVLGGDTQEIGKVIWKNKPMGILSYGNTTVPVPDTQGFEHDVSFERPTPIPIYIYLEITTDPSLFPATGADDIKQAIIDYAANEFGVGDDVIYSRMYTPINLTPGHQVDALFIGTDPFDVTMDNIPIPFNDISSFESINMQIVVN